MFLVSLCSLSCASHHGCKLSADEAQDNPAQPSRLQLRCLQTVDVPSKWVSYHFDSSALTDLTHGPKFCLIWSNSRKTCHIIWNTYYLGPHTDPVKNISDKLPTTYRSHLDHVPDHIRTTLPTTYRPHTDHVTDHHVTDHIPTTLPTTTLPTTYRPRYRPHTDHIHVPTTLPTTYRPRYRLHTGHVTDHIPTTYRPLVRLVHCYRFLACSVTEYSKENLMESRNLATVLFPTIIRPDFTSLQVIAPQMNYGLFIQTCIEKCEYLFEETWSRYEWCAPNPLIKAARWVSSSQRSTMLEGKAWTFLWQEIWSWHSCHQHDISGNFCTHSIPGNWTVNQMLKRWNWRAFAPLLRWF